MVRRLVRFLQLFAAITTNAPPPTPTIADHSPADTTVMLLRLGAASGSASRHAGPSIGSASRRSRNVTWRRLVHSTSGDQTACVSFDRMSMCHIKFERL